MPDPRPLTPQRPETDVRAADPPGTVRYAWAVGSVVVATLLTFALRSALGWDNIRIAFIFFFPAVLVTAVRAGLGPSLLSIALSAVVGNYFFLPPFNGFSLSYDGMLQTGLFLLVAAMLIYLNERSRRAEAEARRSERSLSTTLSSIGDAVIATDAAGRVTFLNVVAERLTGWAAAEAEGRPLAEVFQIFNEDTRAEVESPVAKVLREGVTVGLANHTVLVARDGRETPIDDSAAPIKDARGRTTGVVLVFHDITERRQAELARERLAAIVESSADAIIGKTLDGTVTSWNAAAERLYGYTAEEAVGRPITLIAPEERRPEVSDILARTGRGERVEHLETVRVRKDGTRVEVAVTVSPVVDEEGRVVGASTIARDISARRRFEEESARLTRLVESERRRLRNLVGEVPGVVWEAWGEPDASSQRIDFVSDYVERMLGYTVEEWLSEPNFWLRIVHPDDRERAAREAHEIFDGARGGTSQFRWLAKDGRAVHVEAQSVVILDDAGRPVGMRGVTMDITARTEAEEVVRKSREQLQLALEATNLGICEWELATGRLTWSKEHFELLGYEPFSFEPLYEHFRARLHPEDVESVEREFEAARVERRTTQADARVLLPDGRVRWVHARGRYQFDGAGRAVSLSGLLMDITASRLAQEALRASERHYRALADAMPQIVWTARADGFNDYYNRRWYEYTGMISEQAVGWGWQHVIHPEDAERSVRAWARAVATGDDFQIEYRFRRAADGEYRWHLGRAEALRDGTGRVVKWFGAATDIHEQREAEERIRFLDEASRLLSSSLDYETTLGELARLAVADFADFAFVDIRGDDAHVRRAAVAHRDPARLPLVERLRDYLPDRAKSYGLSTALITGKPQVVAEIDDDFLKAVARDETHLALLRELDGASALTVPLVARGRTFGALTFVTTGTPREYAAEDVAFAEELARRAALAIDNAQLYGRAQEANRAKDEFLATLSHELRTPLTPIIGWTHMMRGGRLGESDIAQGMRVIDRNSQALSRLINDLLDMTSILTGKMRIERAPVVLGDALREAVETVRPQASARRVALEISTGDLGPVTLSGDRTRLVQVFWNLLNNAVKFSPAGGRVRVSCRADGAAALVEVADEGEGIAPAFLPHVFERFRQADMGTTRAHGGLGIGLALVKSFVEAHGGAVSASSAGAGRGSRFTVRLPVLEAPAPAGRPSGELNLEGVVGCPPPACRVLLVEDARDTLDMLRVVFEGRGYEAETCSTPEEALRVAGSGRFDIIVSDIGLPRIDGYELIKRLRQLPHLSKTPAVALTGYAAPRDAEAALDAGFDAHIAKPVDPAALAAQVEELLRLRSQRDGSGEETAESRRQ